MAIFLAISTSSFSQYVKNYYQNGQLRSEGNKINGMQDGEWNYYYDNGHTKWVIMWKMGKQHGLYKRFSNYGTLEVQGYFKNGLEDGEWEYFKNGYVVRREFYKNGKLQY